MLWCLGVWDLCGGDVCEADERGLVLVGMVGWTGCLGGLASRKG